MNRKLRRKNDEDSSGSLFHPGLSAPLDRGRSRKHRENYRHRGSKASNAEISSAGDALKKNNSHE